MGPAKRAARGPACFGPTQARLGTKQLQAGSARLDVAGGLYKGRLFTGPHKTQPTLPLPNLTTRPNPNGLIPFPFPFP
jgi:hypothetical protein